MKVVVDFDLCASRGVCTQIAPDIFEIREDGYLHILNEEPDERDRAHVEECLCVASI